MIVIDKIGAIGENPRSIKPSQWLLIRIEMKLCGMFLIMHQIEADGSPRKRFSYNVQIGDPGITSRRLAWWKVVSDFCQDWVNEQSPAQEHESILTPKQSGNGLD